MDKDIDLNKSGALPEGSSLGNATANSMGGMSTSDAKRGYSTSLDPNKSPGANFTDEAGNTYVGGSPFDRGGFADRANGWER